MEQCGERRKSQGRSGTAIAYAAEPSCCERRGADMCRVPTDPAVTIQPTAGLCCVRASGPPGTRTRAGRAPVADLVVGISADAPARGDLGAAVAMFRAAARLSQRELADLTGWSQPAVSLVETGRRDTLYDIRELLKFADAVAMPREALLPLLLGRPAVLVSATVPDNGQAETVTEPS